MEEEEMEEKECIEDLKTMVEDYKPKMQEQDHYTRSINLQTGLEIETLLQSLKEKDKEIEYLKEYMKNETEALKEQIQDYKREIKEFFKGE